MTTKPDRISAKPASARGRTTSSKPLGSTNSTASTRAKQTPGPAAGGSSLNENKFQRTPNVRSTTSSKTEKASTLGKPTTTPSSSRTPAADVKPRVITDKSNNETERPAPSAPSSKSKALPPPAVPVPLIEGQAPTPTSDPLQVAAQVYPWMYMTSTLEACFQTAEETAKRDLETRSKAIEEEEAGLADQRIRLEAEHAANLYEELATDLFSKEAPSIMQTFLSHGDTCTQVEAEALELATKGAANPDDDAPLQVYNDMLNNLENLQTEAAELETSIIRLTSLDKDADDSSARSQILGVFSACLPVLKARISNLSMAQDLIDSAQENLSITLRMESLGLLD